MLTETKAELRGAAKTNVWFLNVIFVLALIAGVLNTARAADNNIETDTVSICNHCFCHGPTATCNFAHNKTLSAIWNSAYSVPKNIIGIELTLTEQTRFQLHGGLFRRNRNRVNRFVVNGPPVPNGNDQVELLDNVFRDNEGNYPDIQILGVSSVFVRGNAFSDGEIKLRVEKSDYLITFQNAFINMNMSCNFKAIRRLVINERSFSVKSSVNLDISHSHIDQINRFDMSMNKIVFVNCNIGNVQSQAFDVTNIKQVAFENCHIDKIETEAFTSKLWSENVSIIGTHIGTIDSNAINGSGISMLTLKNNTIDSIKEDAIVVHSVYVYFKRNRINHPGKNWLCVNNGELINIEDNHFSNFEAIQLNKDQNTSKRLNCTFGNNWLGEPQPNSLNFNNCRVHGINVNRECQCGDSQNWLPTLSDNDLSSEVYCKLDNRLAACFKTKRMNLRRYTHEVCDRNRTILRCNDNSTLHWYEANYITKEELEDQQRGSSPYKIIGIGIGIVVCLAIVTGLTFISCNSRREATNQDSTRGDPNKTSTAQPIPSAPIEEPTYNEHDQLNRMPDDDYSNPIDIASKLNEYAECIWPNRGGYNQVAHED